MWHTCSLCGLRYQGWGHNAAPFEGRCCDVCNDIHVLPARLKTLIQRDRT